VQRNLAEFLYEHIIILFKTVSYHIFPFLRRLIRFLALPYCLININWNECNRNKILVIFDFLYIFFVLKYYPDNYSSCRLWEKKRSSWVYYYGSNYDPYQRKRLRKQVQPKEYEIVFKDKSLTNSICKANDIPTPRSLGRIPAGENIGDKINSLMHDKNDIFRVILKPLSGKGGNGVIYVEKTDNKLKALQGQNSVNLSTLTSDSDLLIQEFLSQDDSINRIAHSVNTVRIVTLLTQKGGVLLLGTYMRFGTGESKIDNLSQGGICVAVDVNSGQLARIGFDRNAVEFTEHPTSGISFFQYQVPQWEKVKALSVEVQKSFPFYKLLGMDIAITKTGPVIIEINSNYDNVDLEQACGPLLKNNTILKEFAEHKLLINRRQTQLLEKI